MATAPDGGAGFLGGLVGSHSATGKIHASYSSASVKGSAPGTVAQIGGLVGLNAGEIKASYTAGSVTAQTATTQFQIGGLAGRNTGTIQASYSVGPVASGSGATQVGGLVGSNPGSTVTDSYWDTETSGQISSVGGTGKTTAQLKGPTGYDGIYANWNLDLDGDGTADNPWRFPADGYPDLGLRETTDYDTDDDGLIEVLNPAQLNAIRWDVNGNGFVDSGEYRADYLAAFPNLRPGMGCPTGCTGYEIGTEAVGQARIVIDLTGISWASGIPGFSATFEGNGNTIHRLTVLKGGTAVNAGLFDSINMGGVVRNLGLTDVNVRARVRVGALAGQNSGLIVNTYSTGRVTAAATGHNDATLVGGLVGWNAAAGKIYASRSSASVNGSATSTVASIGGLAGESSGEIKASYATGSVTAQGTGDQSYIGGLVGWNAAAGKIEASYSVGVVTAGAGATYVGGLVGRSLAGLVTNSYYDSEVSGQSDTGKGEPRTTAELKGPTGYTGIYANWNLDLDGDGTADNPWRFPPNGYPVLALDAPGVTGATLLSRPSSGDTFTRGEFITVRLTFSEPVTHGGLNWGPYLTLHSEDGWFRGLTGAPATRRGQQYRTLDFTYRVKVGDSVIDRLVVGTHEKLGGGLVMGGVTLTNLTGVPVHPALSPQTFNFKVDGGEALRPEFDGAIGPCREFLTGLSPWSDRYELWRKWGVGCDSRSHPGHHAMYYTFTLENETRARLHVEGSSAYGATPLLILRQGQSYSGDELHRGSAYTVPYFMRIDEVLPAGTYTLEVATQQARHIGPLVPCEDGHTGHALFRAHVYGTDSRLEP